MTVMQTPHSPEYPTEDEISLLDILQVVVDNLRLLVIGPMLAGLLALAVAWVWPKTYESTAILKADQTTASVMLSAAVLDPIARNMGYATTMSTDEARMKLARQVKANINAKDKLLTLTTQADTPQAAQALAQAVLQQTFTLSQPRDNEKLRLEKQLAQAKAREAEATQAMQLLGKKLDATAGVGTSEMAQGYAQMLGVVKESQAAQVDIERQLQSLDTSALVQQPTLPTKPIAPKRSLVAILATLAAGFFLLLFVFLRHSIHNLSQNGKLAQKLETLKIAWRKALKWQ
jgi:LPS O-antigen subunit length determinant protein (WzzB/FepE family)